jgi:hypothetical protein
MKSFLKLKRKGLKPLYVGYEPKSLISLSFYKLKLYISVRSTKIFDIFRNSLILLYIMKENLNFHDLFYQNNPFSGISFFFYYEKLFEWDKDIF